MKNRVLLISLALLLAISVGLVGCDGAQYTLTMAVSPPGAGTTTPTGTTSRAAGTPVNIQATVNGSYQFCKWTAPAGTFGNATAPTTTFTMPAQNVTVTANFVGPLDHFLNYGVTSGAQYIGESLYLEDRFGAVNATVGYAQAFGNPVEKWHGGNVTLIWNPDHHALVYSITCEGEPGEWLVVVENQFGIQALNVSGPYAMATPTQKLKPFHHAPPVALDHSLGYTVIAGEPVNEVVNLYDEFDGFTEVLVIQPIHFGNHARKIHDGNVTEIVNPDVCWVTYLLDLEPPYVGQVQVIDQFSEQTLDVWGPTILSVPSQILHYERIS